MKDINEHKNNEEVFGVKAGIYCIIGWLWVFWFGIIHMGNIGPSNWGGVSKLKEIGCEVVLVLTSSKF